MIFDWYNPVSFKLIGIFQVITKEFLSFLGKISNNKKNQPSNCWNLIRQLLYLWKNLVGSIWGHIYNFWINAADWEAKDQNICLHWIHPAICLYREINACQRWLLLLIALLFLPGSVLVLFKRSDSLLFRPITGGKNTNNRLTLFTS